MSEGGGGGGAERGSSIPGSHQIECWQHSQYHSTLIINAIWTYTCLFSCSVKLTSWYSLVISIFCTKASATIPHRKFSLCVFRTICVIFHLSQSGNWPRDLHRANRASDLHILRCGNWCVHSGFKLHFQNGGGRDGSGYEYYLHGFNIPGVYLASQEVHAELVVQETHSIYWALTTGPRAIHLHNRSLGPIPMQMIWIFHWYHHMCIFENPHKNIKSPLVIHNQIWYVTRYLHSRNTIIFRNNITRCQHFMESQLLKTITNSSAKWQVQSMK